MMTLPKPLCTFDVIQTWADNFTKRVGKFEFSAGLFTTNYSDVRCGMRSLTDGAEYQIVLRFDQVEELWPIDVQVALLAWHLRRGRSLT